MSRRIVPEAINFVAAALDALLPGRKVISLPYPDLKADVRLHVTPGAMPSQPVDLVSADGASLAMAALRLVETFAALYSSSDAFIEMFNPLLRLLQNARVAKLSEPLQASEIVDSADDRRYMLQSPPLLCEC